MKVETSFHYCPSFPPSPTHSLRVWLRGSTVVMFMRQFSKLVVLAWVFYVVVDSDPFPTLGDDFRNCLRILCFGLVQWIHVPASVYGAHLVSRTLFVTASPEEYRKIGSCGRCLQVLALFAHGNLAIILRAPWWLTVTRSVPGSPEECRKIVAFWEMASVDACSCVSLLRWRMFTFFLPVNGPRIPRSLAALPARCFARQRIHVLRRLLGDGGTRTLRSICPALLWKWPCSSDCGSGMCLLVLLVRDTTCCAPFDRRQASGMEKSHSQCFSCEVCRDPLLLTVWCSPSGRAGEEFFQPSTAHSCELSRARGVTGTPGV